MDYLYANIDADIIDSGEVKFDSVSATIDDNIGTPSVEVSLEDNNLAFHFHNLKGNQGVTGSQGEQGAQGPQGIQGVPGYGLDNSGRLDWELLKNVPTEFTPSAHDQSMGTIESNFFNKLDPSIEDHYLPETLNILNEKIDSKPDSIYYYDKTEVDSLLNLKADSAEVLSIENQLQDKQNKLEPGTNIEFDVQPDGTTIINASTDTTVVVQIEDVETNLTEIQQDIADIKTDLSSVASQVDSNLTNINTLGDTALRLTMNLTNKVDKLEGKGLSSNDFTNELKSKLEGIQAGAEANVISSVILNGDIIQPIDKTINLGYIPNQSDFDDLSTKVETINSNWVGNKQGLIDGIEAWVDNNYVSQSTFTEALSDKVDQSTFIEDLASKVDKVEGERLITTAEATKLDGLPINAQENVIEGIKLNGNLLVPENKIVDLGNLVEQEEGKGLSSNDFTNAQETALNDFINNFYNEGSLITVLTSDVVDIMPDESSNKLLTADAIKNYITQVVNERVSPLINQLNELNTELNEITRRVDEIQSDLNSL